MAPNYHNYLQIRRGLHGADRNGMVLYTSHMDPIRVVAASTAANVLEMTRPATQRLLDAGVLGQTLTDGQRTFAYQQAVQDLAAIPIIDVAGLPPALILKVGAPATSEGRRIGWNHLEGDVAKRREPILRWWPVAEDVDLVGHLLVVAVSGVAVDVSRITRVIYDGRAAFEVEEAHDEDAEVWRGHRTKPIPGGLIHRNHL